MMEYEMSLLEKAPVMRTVNELAELLRCNPKLLYSISNNTPDWYRLFSIPKRNGEKRTIEAPKPFLKQLQRRIQDHILSAFPVSPFATAFVPRKNIRSNALTHVNQKTVLNCDVRNFFSSLKSNAVFSLFRTCGYEPDTAMMLTRLCSLYGHLPQGAPTSPMLSNLLLHPLDDKLSQWGEARQLRYSRYADDLTFSGDIDKEFSRETIAEIGKNLAEYGLKLNKPKTRIYHHGNRQLVTGLVVNHQVGVGREKIRDLRTRMHYIELDQQKNRPFDSAELEHLLGVVNYYCDINCSDEHLMEWRERLLEIKRREAND